jgi:hypothetical protein
MKNPDTTERELNAIRTSLYERTKGMSPSELTEYIKARTAPIHEQFGIQPVDRPGITRPESTAKQ